MKNKKLLYFLVPAVLFIWGFVGYRLLNLGQDDDYIEPIRINAISGSSEATRDIKLNLSYPDPFLKGLRSGQLPVATEEAKPIKPPTPVVEIHWGNIRYNGYIQHADKQSRIGLLEVEGVKHLAEVNQHLGALAVKQITRDSILLEKEGKQKWFRSQ